MITAIQTIDGYTVVEHDEVVSYAEFQNVMAQIDVITYDDLIETHHQALLDAQKD